MAASSTPTSTACTLTDTLPPEIRTLILHHLLARDKPIEFWHHQLANEHNKMHTKWVAHPHHRLKNHPGQIFNQETKTWIPAPRLTSILETCKLFAIESAEVLYGSNTFKFYNNTSAAGFLGALSNTKRFIKEIMIDRYGRGSRPAFWESLLPLVNLRSLEIDHLEICYDTRVPSSIKALQRRMLPLLVVLRDSYQQQGLTADPINVFRIWDADYRRCACTCSPMWKCSCSELELATPARRLDLRVNFEGILRKALVDAK